MTADSLQPHETRTIGPLTELAGPIWTAEDFAGDTFIHHLHPVDIDEIHAALWIARERLTGRDLVHDRFVTAHDFPLPNLGQRLHRLSEQARQGRGFAVLRGLPVDELDDADCVLLLRGVATHLGTIATQTRDGQLVRHVKATGASLGDAAVRGHQTAERLYFHTDGADAAVLLCRRGARSGGLSRVASAISVHNRMLAADPDLVGALYRPFDFHMAGGHAPGCSPTFSSRIFSVHRGLFSCRYVRHTLLETPTVTGVPLPARALDAFDALEATAADGSLDMELQAGDLQVVNNHTVLHSRTSYDDDPNLPRHLLRAWLTFSDYAGRRPGLVDEGLRFGWLTDEVQERLTDSSQACAPWLEAQ